jgi:hypothetical protein
MNKLLCTIGLLGSIYTHALAQTSPAPFDLSSGTYTFTQWDSLSAVATYPANMIFHTLGNQNPTENTPANGDWACSYGQINGCSIRGLALNGVSFRNIGQSQAPACMANGTGTSIYVGDATVALNTTGCNNISVSWIGRMNSSFTYSDSTPVSRFYGIACQYRIGSTGAFTNVPGNYLFACNSDSITYKPLGSADTLISLLPDTCNNQPLIELRWIYHQTDQNSGGPRPVLSLDDINISRDIITATGKSVEPYKALVVYPNPVTAGKINLNKTCNFVVVDMLGQVISKPVLAKDFAIDHLSRGFYFIKTSEGEIVKFIKQ